MLQAFFHAWERRLASVTKDRVVRPFDWGLEWIPDNGHRPGAPAAGNVSREPDRGLPFSLDAALVELENAKVMPHYMGADYVRLYRESKAVADYIAGLR